MKFRDGGQRVRKRSDITFTESNAATFIRTIGRKPLFDERTKAMLGDDAWRSVAFPLFSQLSAVLLVVLLLGYKYVTYHNGKWKRLDVPHVEPTPLFGNFGDSIMGRVPLVDLVQSLYDRYSGHPYFGVYGGRQPQLVLRDPELVHAVMVRDFAHFYDRIPSNTSFKHDHLFEHLFNMRGEKWKSTRAKLSPTFSGAKLKSMMADMNVCTTRLINNLNEQIKNKNGVVDISESSAQFTTDTIGCCAFGLDCNALSDPDSEFRQVGRDVFTPTRKQAIFDFIRLIDLGWLIDVFRMRGLNSRVYDFFDYLFESTMKQHETGENKRNDFIALLVKLKADEKENDEKLFSDDVLSANAFIFFIAGFETTASTISYCLYELAKNPEIQNKLREQIKETLDTNQGKISYDTLKDLTYLDMVINETLRMHPPVPVLNRACTKKYTVPGSSITLNVGEKLIIPAYALHHDPRYYPSPEIFDPERFTEENKTLRPHGTFLPFGDGPRFCIGMRFAIMEIKIGLAEILSEFNVLPCEDTPVAIKIRPRSFLLTPNEPIRLTFEKIQ